MTIPLIRQYLRDNPDGARIPSIAKATGSSTMNTEARLKKMPDCYIDRWERTTGPGGFGPVWCAASIPEHCPKPELR